MPILLLDNGTVITESVAIIHYLYLQAQSSPRSSDEEAKQLEKVAFISTEIYKPIALLKLTHDRSRIIEKIKDRFQQLDSLLENHDYLLGHAFSPADAFLFVVSRWAAPNGIEISSMKNIQSHQLKIKNRESVQSLKTIHHID